MNPSIYSSAATQANNPYIQPEFDATRDVLNRLVAHPFPAQLDTSLAIPRGDLPWMITHMASGKSVIGWINGERPAREALAVLGSLADWSFPEKPDDTHYEAIAAAEKIIGTRTMRDLQLYLATYADIAPGQVDNSIIGRLTQQQLEIVFFLTQHRPCATTLAARFQPGFYLEAPRDSVLAMLDVLNTLVTMGLVIREPDEDDGVVLWATSAPDSDVWRIAN